MSKALAFLTKRKFVVGTLTLLVAGGTWFGWMVAMGILTHPDKLIEINTLGAVSIFLMLKYESVLKEV